jgi:hypothetical protein
MGRSCGRAALSSIERTAYPRFPRLISARELHVFYTPASEEITWAGEVTNSDESVLVLMLALKCFQRMGRFPRDEEIPELVVDHVRRGLGLDAGVSAVYGSDRTRRHHRGLVRKRVGVIHNPARAREVAAGAIWEGSTTSRKPQVTTGGRVSGTHTTLRSIRALVLHLVRENPTTHRP